MSHPSHEHQNDPDAGDTPRENGQKPRKSAESRGSRVYSTAVDPTTREPAPGSKSRKDGDSRLEDNRAGSVAGAISNNPNLLKAGIIGHIRGAQEFLRVRSVIRNYVEESLGDVMADDSRNLVDMTTAIIMASNFKYQR